MRKIIIDASVCKGLPTIEDERITVQTVLRFLSAGDSIEDVLQEYPTLCGEDVPACLAHCARLLKHHFFSSGAPLSAFSSRDLTSLLHSTSL